MQSSQANVERITRISRTELSSAHLQQNQAQSYARRNKTRQALWEYDIINKSLYLLDFVDRLSLRQNIQQVLNRGEGYHQLRRAISYANFGQVQNEVTLSLHSSRLDSYAF